MTIILLAQNPGKDKPLRSIANRYNLPGNQNQGVSPVIFDHEH
jgi:hypothetical protein